MAEQHEHHHQAPQQIVPTRLGDYLEEMSKSVFQSGISWKVVDAKWPGIRMAFKGFDAMAVASLDGQEMADLQKDPRVIRNARKLDGIVHNARTMIDLEEKHCGLRNHLRSHGGFEETVKDMRKRFK